MQPDNRAKKHVPEKGETVTFTANIQNKGKAPSAGRFAWLVDGREVDSGTIKTLNPRERASFDLKWKWDPADHDVTFKLTPAAEDYCPRNNELTVRNNAIVWKHVVEKGTLAEVEQKTNMIGSYSFEDWLQGQARFMNQLFAESKYDFAPNGITARVMIGKIEYVEDGEIARRCPGGPFQIGEQSPQYDGGRGCTLRDTFWNTGVQGPQFLNSQLPGQTRRRLASRDEPPERPHRRLRVHRRARRQQGQRRRVQLRSARIDGRRKRLAPP